MTNLEYYKDELIKMERVAIIKNKPKNCKIGSGCSGCRRLHEGECSETILMNWLAKEHIDYPKLTKLQKAILFQLLDNEYKWLVRDKFNTLEVYIDKPHKEQQFWESEDEKEQGLVISKPLETFDFVKWEDSKPWSIEELLFHS